MDKRKKIKVHPYIFIILSFLGVILLGTLLLLLPISVADGTMLDFVDALFISTSSICVTGLTVVDISARLSIFGKVVMAFLMEIGGLSFLTIAVYIFTVLGAKIGISNRYLMKEALNQNSLSGIISLVKRIMIIAFAIQLFGVVLNYLALMDYYDYRFWPTLGASLYHSVASFNNAGFDIFGPNSMIPFKDNVLLNISTILLIFFGGLGFYVINDIITKRSFLKLSMHSKIVLIMTFFLIISGTIFFKLSMWDDITWLQALFTSVTCRTAGFTTVDLSTLPPGAYITAVVLMFIGASPGSTGGGVKTTTLFVIFLTVLYYAQGKKPKIFKRRVADSSIFKAFVLFGIAVLAILFSTFVIGLIQPQLSVEKILFEVTSAFSTTGLTMGITMSLEWSSKIILCLLMFFGRVGPLTIIGVVNRNWMTESKEAVQYVEERVIVG